jgi:hypothetical protein
MYKVPLDIIGKRLQGDYRSLGDKLDQTMREAIQKTSQHVERLLEELPARETEVEGGQETEEKTRKALGAVLTKWMALWDADKQYSGRLQEEMVAVPATYTPRQQKEIKKEEEA